MMEAFLMSIDLEEDYGIHLIARSKFSEARIYYEYVLQKVTAKFGGDKPECVDVKEKLAFSMYLTGNYFKAKELFEDAVRQREITLPDSHPHCIRIYMFLSILIKNIGKKSEEDCLIEKLRTILGNVEEMDDFARSYLVIAISYLNLNKTLEAERILKDFLQNKGNKYWKNLPLSLLIMVEIGHTLLRAGRHSEAIKYIEDILKSNSDLYEKQYPLYYQCRMDVALCYIGMDKPSEARTQLNEIFREHTKRFADTNVEKLDILNVMAECRLQEHYYEEAKSLFEEILNDQAEIYGKDSPFSIQMSLNICKTLIYMRKFSEAMAFNEKLSRKIDLLFGTDNQLYLNALRLKATSSIEMGKYEEATLLLGELLVNQLEVSGENHSDYVECRKMFAEVHYTLRNFSKSLCIFEDALRLQSSILGADHPECMKMKMWIAQTCIKVRKFAESETLLKEVIKSLKENVGEEHSYSIDAMGLLAATLFSLGKKEEGRPLLEIYASKMEVKRSNLDVISIILVSLEGEEKGIVTKLLESCLKASIDFLCDYHAGTIDFQALCSRQLLIVGRLTEAKEMIVNAHAKLKELRIGYDRRWLAVRKEVAEILISVKEKEKAIILLEKNVSLYEKAGEKSVELAANIFLIVEALDLYSERSRKKQMVEKGLIQLSEVDFNDDLSWINKAPEWIKWGLGYCYCSLVINICRKLLSLPHKIFGENHPKYFDVMEYFGDSLNAAGERIERRRVYLEILKKIKEIHGDQHSTFIRIQNKLRLM